MNITDFNNYYWGELGKKVNKAVVFLDAAASESLHWAGGLQLLSKASMVKEFSVLESAPSNFKKGVFLVSQPLQGAALATLRAILESSALEYCVTVGH